MTRQVSTYGIWGENIARYPVIVGVDPGTTVGYAVAKLEGTKLSIKTVDSTKHISQALLLSILTRKGQIVIVATDKKKAPQAIQRLATKSGAYLYTPDRDLKVVEKRRLVASTGWQTKNDHERDALAALFYAVSRLRPLIQTAHDYLKKAKRSADYADALRFMLHGDEFDIKAALRKIDLMRRPRLVHVQKKTTIPEDPVKLADRIVKLRENLKLKDAFIEQLKREIEGLKKRRPKEKKERPIISRKNTVDALRRSASELRTELNRISKEHMRLIRTVAQQDEFIVLKKMEDFGWDTYNAMKDLHIRKDDLVIVREPNVFSQRTIAGLRRKGPKTFIIASGMPSWAEDLKEFSWIRDKYLEGTDFESIRIVPKSKIDSALASKDLLQQIVADYRKKRST